MINLKVHFVFPGTCEEALLFYAAVLGGTVDFVFRKKENPSLEVDETEREKIEHMVIKTPYFELGGEDEELGQDVRVGNNYKLILEFFVLEECRRVFEQISIGGNITVPLEPNFFSEACGEVTDKYGVRWLLMMTDENYSKE